MMLHETRDLHRAVYTLAAGVLNGTTVPRRYPWHVDACRLSAAKDGTQAGLIPVFPDQPLEQTPFLEVVIFHHSHSNNARDGIHIEVSGDDTQFNEL